MSETPHIPQLISADFMAKDGSPKLHPFRVENHVTHIYQLLHGQHTLPARVVSERVLAPASCAHLYKRPEHPVELATDLALL